MNDTESMETTTQLKKLTLKGLSELKRVWGENSQRVFSFRNLKEVIVSDCKILQTLFPSSLAKTLEKLEKLKIESLSISNCPNLQYLFSSSAAKNLMNLEEIRVEKCGSMKEIVAKWGHEDEHEGKGEDKYENEMRFAKLEILTLCSLPKFESFYTGSSTLNFPSLKKVEFTKCYNMTIFHHGDKVPAELMVTIDGVHWEGGINSVIIQQLEEVAA
uniref:Disease resistance protein At4g27190-like leucine-rich repeats domain-containing protein n=1 Tax=Cajanus cajan TaxID=3821 RepID=A0A151UCH3_CAJCA|nr:hypothetical protein KK1_021252 [Cajanus cajan]